MWSGFLRGPGMTTGPGSSLFVPFPGVRWMRNNATRCLRKSN